MYTTAQRAEVEECMGRLTAALQPFVAAVADAKVQKVLEETVDDSPEVLEFAQMAKDGFAEMMRDEGASEQDIAEQLAEFERLRHDPAENAKAAADFRETETTHACVLLVRNWVSMCERVARTNGGLRTIDATTLDDDMLPRGPKAIIDTQFLNRFDNSVIDGDEALSILRAYRASLPEGKLLPDEMAALLACYGVTFTNLPA